MSTQEYHCVSNGSPCGPYTREMLADHLAGGLLNSDDKVFVPTTNSWLKLDDFLKGYETAESRPNQPLTPPPMKIRFTPSVVKPPSELPEESITRIDNIQPKAMPSIGKNGGSRRTLNKDILSQFISWANESAINYAMALGGSLLVAALILMIAGYYSPDRQHMQTETNKQGSKQPKAVQAHNASVLAFFDFERQVQELEPADNLGLIVAIERYSLSLTLIDIIHCPRDYKIEFSNLARTVHQLEQNIRNNGNAEAARKLTLKIYVIRRSLTKIMLKSGYQLKGQKGIND
jgi:hypothetical protein